MTKPALIIHGGFFTEHQTDPLMKAQKQQALLRIVREGWEYLQTHTAFETVVFCSILLEDDPLFNAGTGSQIQSDGVTRMSAAVCDGTTGRFSGVINIENVKNPILIASRLQQEEDRVLGGEGALKYAREHGFDYYNPQTDHRIREYEEKRRSLINTGTIGCVALDFGGALAAATSTGGKGFELVGRISDSATVAGNYANSWCGVSCTGVGEDIINGAMAAKIVTRVTDGMTLGEALRKTFDEIKPFDGFAGVIAIDSYGNIGHQDSHPSMVYAWKNRLGESVFD